ncbi:MAG: ribonuclease H-like domain-containing protein, partial [Patescibacteria group bacterium]
LYFYGIKDIGGYIGFKRSKKISGGGESVAYYEEWLDTHDRRKLEAIMTYNEDDVVATRFLKDWLADLPKEDAR